MNKLITRLAFILAFVVLVSADIIDDVEEAAKDAEQNVEDFFGLKSDPELPKMPTKDEVEQAVEKRLKRGIFDMFKESVHDTGEELKQDWEEVKNEPKPHSLDDVKRNYKDLAKDGALPDLG